MGSLPELAHRELYILLCNDLTAGKVLLVRMPVSVTRVATRCESKLRAAICTWNDLPHGHGGATCAEEDWDGLRTGIHEFPEM